ncbi:hypothetical protein H5410_002565 [Solanum commersonii]|uniref:Uncharacterized protein n=1 Tax=Solanum commersonii TaxID=4109 RepID=A0A9J6B2G7_SOLCO|nr:hypothetical protein H5410_002565 [Solanum commersonii]
MPLQVVSLCPYLGKSPQGLPASSPLNNLNIQPPSNISRGCRNHILLCISRNSSLLTQLGDQYRKRK